MSRISLQVGAAALLVLACRSSAAPNPEAPSLRVLVELRMAGAAAPGEPREGAIREAAERLETALESADIPFEVVRRFDTIPWIALRIAASDRARVAALPEVIAVRDDELQRIQ
jgi:hypothetical protein